MLKAMEHPLSILPTPAPRSAAVTVGPRAAWLRVVLGPMMLAGCLAGQTGESPIDPHQEPDDPMTPLKPDEPGGAVECYTAAECEGHLGGELDGLSQPEADRRHYATGTCALGWIGQGVSSWDGPDGEPSCQCGDDASGILLSGTSPEPCLHFGRDRTCLYRTDEFPGCDDGDREHGCDAVCADFDARIEADAARSLDVALEAVDCIDFACRGILRIEDACYLDMELTGNPCDGDLDALLVSEVERLNAQWQTPAPACDAIDADAPDANAGGASPGGASDENAGGASPGGASDANAGASVGGGTCVEP